MGFWFASFLSGIARERRFIVVGSIASGGLAMHVSAWIIVPWLWGSQEFHLAVAGERGLFICTIDLGFLSEAGRRWSGMGWSPVNMLEK
jgi:hypothetical protein